MFNCVSTFNIVRSVACLQLWGVMLALSRRCRKSSHTQVARLTKLLLQSGENQVQDESVHHFVCWTWIFSLVLLVDLMWWHLIIGSCSLNVNLEFKVEVPIEAGARLSLESELEVVVELELKLTLCSKSVRVEDANFIFCKMTLKGNCDCRHIHSYNGDTLDMSPFTFMGDCTQWCQSTRRTSYVEVASFIYCHSGPVQTAPASGALPLSELYAGLEGQWYLAA